jgi:hypothetical protein
VPFAILRGTEKHILPMSHTCFSQLVLPEYETKEELSAKLGVALDNATGFGMI